MLLDCIEAMASRALLTAFTVSRVAPKPAPLAPPGTASVNQNNNTANDFLKTDTSLNNLGIKNDFIRLTIFLMKLPGLQGTKFCSI